MKPLFWISLALVFYAYAGYPLLLILLHRLRPYPVAPGHLDPQPSVSIIMAARNEAANLPRKLANLAELDYPSHLLEILLVSDGSSDDTPALLAAHAAADPRLRPILLPTSVGKAASLNAAVAQASGDLLLFLDVRQTVSPEALRALVQNFADPAVGAVSGELLLLNPDGTPAGDSLGLYWRIEKLVRRLESTTGSVVGVTGAIYAIRRQLFTPLPPGLILDDVLVPMQVARTGHRVLFEPRATATDRIFSQSGKEFRRKVRTLTGNYQLLQLAPWLLSPAANPLLFRLVSHKLARLAVPVLLLIMLLTSALAGTPFFHFVLVLQLAFYLLATAGSLLPATKRLKPVSIAHTVVLLNVAAAMALYNFLTGRDKVWT